VPGCGAQVSLHPARNSKGSSKRNQGLNRLLGQDELYSQARHFPTLELEVGSRSSSQYPDFEATSPYLRDDPHFAEVKKVWI
jgi:hypothetical protein